MHILVIEDNRANADLYIRLLKRLGCTRVELQETGLTGLQAALGTPFDACFIDLDLPDMDGLQVGLALRRHQQAGRLAALPLIALTARSDTLTQAEAERLGFDALLCKPCGDTELAAVLARLVGRGGG